MKKTAMISESWGAQTSLDGRRHLNVAQAVLLLVTLGAATIASVLAHGAGHPVTAALVFVMTVLVNGSLGGLSQGMVAAVVASVIYTLFVRFPVFAKGLDAIDDIVPLAALSITAVLSGIVSGQLRDRANAAERARLQLTRLLGFSGDLQKAIDLDAIAAALVEAIGDRSTLLDILARLRADYGLGDSGPWEQAITTRLENLIETPSGAMRAMAVDRRGMASLTALAIERCELLEERAAATAVIKSERLKTALLSSLSHDLRTPLAAISASASSLSRYGAVLDEGSRAEMLDTIQEQCDRLNAFTAKLLSLSRLEAGLDRRSLEIVDVEEVLGSAISAIRAVHAEHNVIRSITAPGALTLASPVLLEQVIFNVLENAVRYSEPGTNVEVALTHEGDMTVVTITDAGCGIASADLPHIFERFYRGMSNGERNGHGLGLAIVKAFIDVIGGQIAVASPAPGGVGTQVRIALPDARIAQGEAVDA